MTTRLTNGDWQNWLVSEDPTDTRLFLYASLWLQKVGIDRVQKQFQVEVCFNQSALIAYLSAFIERLPPQAVEIRFPLALRFN